MLKQQSSRKELKQQISKWNQGLAVVENPILGDQYAYKLSLLKNNVDLAQEGKMTYEAGEARARSEVKINPQKKSREEFVYFDNSYNQV